MTHSDSQFLKGMGIEPCSLTGPFPRPPPPAEPPGAWYIPFVMVGEETWLLNLKILWEQEPEPGFVPPKTFKEYLARYPNGVREGVGWRAKRLELTLSQATALMIWRRRRPLKSEAKRS